MPELRVLGLYFIQRNNLLFKLRVNLLHKISIFIVIKRNPATGLYSFLGIRYADAPIGENRFLRPKYLRLQGDINATIHGPPCPQPDPHRRGYVIGDEDCLRLNVFTPQMPDETTGLPVLVFIHGGGFRYIILNIHTLQISQIEVFNSLLFPDLVQLINMGFELSYNCYHFYVSLISDFFFFCEKARSFD